MNDENLYELYLYDYGAECDDYEDEMLRIGNEFQRGFNLYNGPLVRGILFKTQKKDYFLFIIHHLVVDGISWRILIEDLNTIYMQIKNNENEKLPAKTLSFQMWSEYLKQFSLHKELQKEIPYWRTIEEIAKCCKFPLNDTIGNSGKQFIKYEFDKDFTNNLLLDTNLAYNTEINDLLLTALFRSISKLTKTNSVAINLEGHGRELLHVPVAIDRTVGWFTTVYPVAVTGIGTAIRDDIIIVKEALRRIPNHGLGYGVIANYTKELDGIISGITFNYLGDFGNETEQYELKINTVEYGEQVSPNNQFGSPISIDGSIVDDKLKIVMSYNTDVCDECTASGLIRLFVSELNHVVNHCMQKTIFEKTVSDYGETDWQIDEFYELQQELMKRNIQIERIYPLTPMQEGILFSEISGKKKNTYVVISEYDILGTVNIDRLHDSFELLIYKYSVLRSNFIYQGFKDLRQIIRTDCNVIFQVVELKEQIEEGLENIRRNELERGFDLSRDSLFRVIVVKTCTGLNRLVLCFHHIIMDGWCTQLLLEDLNFFYTELDYGMSKEQVEKNIVPDLVHEKYVRFLEHMDYDNAYRYWENVLNDYDTNAIIRPEGIARNYKDASRHVLISLNREITQKINNLCISLGVTTNVFFEAVWGLLLEGYTGSNDVVFGRVVSGRDKCVDGIEKSVGLFINTIPVRFTTQNEQTFSDILCKLHNQLLESSVYDYCPLADIQNKCGLGNSLIQSLVAFENYDQGEINEPLKLNLYSTIEEANYPLTLSIKKTKSYEFDLMYDNEYYTYVEIENIMNRYKDLLVRLLENPTILISGIELCTESEISKIVCSFNSTFTEYPRNKTIAELFEEQVMLNKNKIAVSYKNEEITYEQLNDKANQVAHALRELGIEPGKIVGVAAERNMQTIINFLAVIKSGGGYLPLDIKNPVERTKFILLDSNCKIVIDNNDSLELQRIPNINKLGKMQQQKKLDNKNPNNINQPEDVAYIIYTSGTTGEPKGTIISQKNILHLVLNTNYISFNDISILQTGSLTFDACTFEIWGALLNGGRLHIADETVLYDTVALNKCINEKKINSMFLTTALFNQIIDINPMAFKGIKELLVGGEKMANGPVEVFIRNNPEIIFSNIYGPTECTTFALSEKFDGYVPNVIPIGKPIMNTTAYVMKNNKLCGIGIPGELCIGGDGVSIGYLNQKELTEKKFIENSYVNGERIYRTGDLVRWLHNGSIDYLGRIDQQVKIRGFRIELHEVTNALKELSGISDAIVTIYEKNNDKYLCAYIKTCSEINSMEIRTQLRRKLPEYMVPPYIIKVGHLPVNKNGKIDKLALPEPQITSSKEYISPRTDIEKRIVEIIKEILGVQKVGINDDFMQLGGHSLKAIRLTCFLNKEFGCNISTRDVLENGAVENLAMLVGKTKKNSYRPIEKSYNINMSSAQKRLFSLQQLNKRSVTYNIPIALLIEGVIDVEKLKFAIRKLSLRHDILRTYFESDEKGFYRRIANSLNIDFKSVEVEEKNLKESIWNAQEAFDLSIPPLFRVYLFHMKNNRNVLLIDIHHTIFDGGSVEPFIKELSMIYNCEPIGNVEHQYSDYVGWAEQLDCSAEEEFWKAELSSLDIETSLREDFPRQINTAYKGESINIGIEKDVLDKINNLGKLLGVTNYMIYLAAASELLSRYTREEKVVLGIAASGRNHPDLQNMIGMFVNTLVYVCDIEKSKSFREHVLSTKEKCLQIFDNQNYQYEDMVEKFKPNMEMARNPFFDIMFSMENIEPVKYMLGSAKVSEYSLSNNTAKFDLVINIKESKDNCFICWEYNKGLFKKETIEILAENFDSLLRNMLDNIDEDMEKVAVINNTTQTYILNNFVEPLKQEVPVCTVAEYFEKVAAENPDMVVAEFNNDVLTYKQLNNRANCIARFLRDEGVGRNDIVAISLERSLEMLVSIVGILKSGAAYLPIDPNNPIERTNYILNDSKAKMVLTAGCQHEFIVKFHNVLNIHGEYGNLKTISRPEDLAYVIYTSGTTGNPKGVMIEQYSLLNLT